MRWSVAGAMAASIALAVVFGTINLRSASAADVLAQCAQASSQFKGWVHIRESIQGEKNFFVQHINNETGAWASERHVDGGLDVQMYLPAENEEIKYSSGDGQVKIGEISPEFASRWKTEMQHFPLTKEALLAKVPGATVRRSDDGGLIRFDVAFPADDTRSAQEQNRTEYPSSAVVWIDPTSKLIVKGQSTTDGKLVTMQSSYGDPAVRDVFDVGVPKNAKVVDLRPPRNVNVLMGRLRKRFDDGFGDFVGVGTTTVVSSVDGKQSPPEREIEIYGASGPAYAAETFNVDAAASVDAPATGTWPAERLDAVLKMLSGRIPNSFFVGDGENAWQGYASVSGGIQSTKIQGTRAVQQLSELKKMYTLAGRLWPVRDLSTFGTDAKSQIVTDPARAGQIGLRIDRLYFVSGPDDTKLAQTYWFDPAKDDLTVKGADIYTSTTTNKVVQESHLATSAFAQTQDGKWYPSQWTQNFTMYSPQRTTETSTDTHLQIWTNKSLGPDWFVDPATKAKAKP